MSTRRKYKTNKKAKAKAAVSTVPLNPVQKKEVIKLAEKDDEVKHYTFGGNNIPFFNAGGAHLVPIMTVTQGPADNQRIGDMAKLKSLRFRCGIVNNIGSPSILARIVVFQYNSNNVVAPPINNMFYTGAGAGTVNTYSALNTDNSKIFKVLYDKVIRTVGIITTGVSLPNNYTAYTDFYVPLKFARKKIQFIAGSTSATNQIYFLIMSDLPTSGANPLLSYDCSVKYTDK